MSRRKQHGGSRLSMSVEEGIRLIISGGAVVEPEQAAAVGQDHFVNPVGEQKAAVIGGYPDLFFGDELIVIIDYHGSRFAKAIEIVTWFK